MFPVNLCYFGNRVHENSCFPQSSRLLKVLLLLIDHFWMPIFEDVFIVTSVYRVLDLVKHYKPNAIGPTYASQIAWMPARHHSNYRPSMEENRFSKATWLGCIQCILRHDSRMWGGGSMTRAIMAHYAGGEGCQHCPWNLDWDRSKISFPWIICDNEPRDGKLPSPTRTAASPKQARERDN